jgi:hypothetical protein
MPATDLVLEGGGAKGLATTGAVIRLLDAGYHFERVAGTSVGAIAAAFAAAGLGLWSFGASWSASSSPASRSASVPACPCSAKVPRCCAATGPTAATTCATSSTTSCSSSA